MKLLLFLFLFLSCAGSTVKSTGEIGSYTFSGPAISHEKPVAVHYFLPPELNENTRIFFVMHGINRNAPKYLDAWKDYALKHQVLLVAPEFSKEFYKGSDLYNLGNMKPLDETTQPESMWTFHVIDRIFDDIKERFHNKTETYDIYGHSAGAQFVHRLVIFCPHAKIGRAFAANAGWYTFLSPVAFPYGIGKRYKNDLLTQALKKDLYILLGENDINPASKRMRKTTQAQKQGNNRFERGHNFIAEAGQVAKNLNVPFKWKLKVIPDAAHNNQKIADYISHLNNL